MILRKPQSSNEMHTQVAANLLKLFTRRLFCMVVLRFSATGKAGTSAERSAPAGASTSRSRARRGFLGNTAPRSTATNQSNVIRIHTSRRKPPLETGWPPDRPPAWRSSQPPGSTSSTQKSDFVAKDSRVLQRQERRRICGERGHRQRGSCQWRVHSAKTPRAFHQLSKARDCRGLVTSNLCGQFVV
jgi:hypothetical protein